MERKIYHSAYLTSCMVVNLFSHTHTYTLIHSSAYYELRCDGGQPEKQKSSGLLVYTGTGSTSWYVIITHTPCRLQFKSISVLMFSTGRAYNVNKLMPFQVRNLFKLAEEKGSPSWLSNHAAMEEIVNRGEVTSSV